MSSFLRFPYFPYTFPVCTTRNVELEREAARGVLRSNTLPFEKSERVHVEKERVDASRPFCSFVMIFHHNIEGLEAA